MSAVTIEDLIAQIRSQADMVGSSFVDDTTELIPWINRSAAELYDLVVSRYEDDYTIASGAITVSSGNAIDVTALSPAFYKLRGVDMAENGATDWRDLRMFDFNMRNRRMSAGGSWYRSRTIRFRLVGSNILLTPDDACSGVYRVWYIPQYQNVSSINDTLDFSQNWYEFIVADVAAKCLAKEESSTAEMVRMREACRARILAMSPNRDAGSRMRIEDVHRRRNYEDGEF